jgi:hypothetical protein
VRTFIHLPLSSSRTTLTPQMACDTTSESSEAAEYMLATGSTTTAPGNPGAIKANASNRFIANPPYDGTLLV